MATSTTPARLTPDTTEPKGREVPGTPDGPDSPEPGLPPKKDPPPLRSVHTSNFSPILQELGISVLVTTYQAGKQAIDPELAHREFRRPSSLACEHRQTPVPLVSLSNDVQYSREDVDALGVGLVQLVEALCSQVHERQGTRLAIQRVAEDLPDVLALRRTKRRHHAL